MVAITVILAAVIGSFVLGLGEGISDTVQAGASVQTTSSDEIKVTWTTNQNADDLDVDVSGCMSASTSLTQVGASWTTSTGGCSDGETATVIVTANNAESSTVIIDKDVEF